MGAVSGNEGRRDAASAYAPYWKWLVVLPRRRRLVLGVILLTSAASIGQRMLRTVTYTSAATFVARQNQGGARGVLASLVAGTGISLPGMLGGSSFYYLEVIRADDVLRKVVEGEVEMSDGRIVSLPDLLQVEGKTLEARISRTVRRVRRSIETRHLPNSGRVSFTVKTQWPEVSFVIAERLLAEVSRFNVLLLQSRGRAERRFLEERLKIAQGEVRAWEDSLQSFLAGNRQFGPYSQQRFEHDRIMAELQRTRTVYGQLIHGREQALLTEIGEAPTIIILNTPKLPIQLDSRLSPFFVIATAFMSVMAGIFCAYAAETAVWLRRHPIVQTLRRSIPRSSATGRMLARILREPSPAPRDAAGGLSTNNKFDS